jgi:hypothetical protein
MAGIGIDPMAAARAQAAFEAVWGLLQVAIHEVTKDHSLSADQRAAAIRALRERHAAQAAASRKRIMDEERAAARERRRIWARPTRKPCG